MTAKVIKPGEELGPNVVKVLPADVAPYENEVTLNPLTKDERRGYKV